MSDLPRCKHGSAMLDGAGEKLEPPCGCRWLFSDEEIARIVAKAPPWDDGPDTSAFERMAIDLHNAHILIRSQAKEIERLRGTVFVCERDVDGVKASVHMGQHCESCGHTSRFEASHCPECGVARP